MHFFTRLCAGLLLAATTLAAQAASHTYTLDPNHTDIIVTWDHLGYAHPSAMFNQISGTVTYDPEHPERASVQATMPLSSVHTASPALDEHLQSADFFDGAKYPEITFKSTKVVAGDAPNTLKVTGNVSAHGKTVPVTLDVTINKMGTRRGHPHIAFNATTTLQRSDFDVALYAPSVSDEVQLTLTAGGSAPAEDSKPAAKPAD